MVDSILPFVLAHFLLGYGLAYTPASSVKRPILLGLIVVCCLISVRSSIARRVPGLVGCEYVIGFIFHASHFLCLAGLSPPPRSKTSAKNAWALNQLFNPRWGIAYIPPFSTKDKLYVPSRLKLFLHRLWDAVWTVGVIYLLQTYQLNTVREDYTVPSGFLRRLADVTPREWVVRIYMTVIGYLVPYCSLRAGHSIFTCLALALGDTPERWPPLFGSLSDAYTVRRFWSHFWHHLMRKAFTSHARFFVQNILRLPQQGPVTRYVTITVTFMISALLHVLANPGYEWCCLGIQMPIYVSIIGAVLIEDTLIGAYGSIFKPALTIGSAASADRMKVVLQTKNRTRVVSAQEHAETLMWKLAGFSWVVMFEIWATSKMMYSLWNC